MCLVQSYASTTTMNRYFEVKRGCFKPSETANRLAGSSCKDFSSKSISSETKCGSSAPALELRTTDARSLEGKFMSTCLSTDFPVSASSSYCLKRVSVSKCGSNDICSYDRIWFLIILLGKRPFIAICKRSISLFVRPGNITWPVKSSYKQTAMDHKSRARSSARSKREREKRRKK